MPTVSRPIELRMHSKLLFTKEKFVITSAQIAAARLILSRHALLQYSNRPLSQLKKHFRTGYTPILPLRRMPFIPNKIALAIDELGSTAAVHKGPVPVWGA